VAPTRASRDADGLFHDFAANQPSRPSALRLAGVARSVHRRRAIASADRSPRVPRRACRARRGSAPHLYQRAVPRLNAHSVLQPAYGHICTRHAWVTIRHEVVSLDLRKLQCFVAVAEELSFRRAAQRLFLVQPTVTLQIQQLERELRVALFDRSTRPIKLTPAGQRYLHEVRAALEMLRQAADVAREPQSRPPVLRIGTVGGLGERLTRLLSTLRNRAPHIEVELHSMPCWSRLQQLRERRLDAAFMRWDVGVSGLMSFHLWWERLVAVTPADISLAKNGVVALNELRHLPLRLVSRESDPRLHDFVIAQCRSAGYLPILGRPFTTLQDTIAEIGFGAPAWAVLYESEACSFPTREVAFCDIGPPALRVPMFLAMRNLEGATEPLLEACHSVVNETYRDKDVYAVREPA
jgi:DNA-binding transcriptional LysR family regulator